MNRFHYSQTYTFDAPKGQRKDYFFNMVERHGSNATFRLNDKDNTETIDVNIIMEGDTETATFTFRGIEFSLRADRFISKCYPMTPQGRIEKENDKLKDAHIHTSYNRDEIERSKVCYCISCQTFFKPEEVTDYADGGKTGICPYCGIDAIIADGSGIKMTNKLLVDLHLNYFNYSTNPLIELTIDEANESKPTPCSPYVWIVRIQNQDGCAVDADFYTREEAKDKLREFLSEIPSILFRTTFEAIECRLHDIEGDEALDAILLAFSRYFEEDDAPHIDASQFKINHDIDFAITTAWNGETDHFTLLSSGEIEFHSA